MEKNLSLNEIRTRCAQFVVNWRDASGEERQEDQSFVRDLLQAYGISETKAALYQKRAKRSSTGNQGYIDALVPGLLLIEMKSAGKSLALAEAQALDYIHHLDEPEVPRFVLTCDFKNFRLLDLKAPRGADTTEFDLEQLPSKAELLSFLAGYESRKFGHVDQQEASIKAAKLMGELFEALEGSGYSEHESSIFLVRTLFALYADDAGLWQRDTFTDFINQRTSPDGSDLGAQLSMLFQILNQPLDKRFNNLDEMLQRFPYINGGVFSEPLAIPSFDSRMRETLLKACAFNWSTISPAIFGSLFQAVKSAEARRDLGEHYTTETNIRKVIDPLFLDELIQRYESVRHDQSGLRKLREHLGQIRILDPACGCGNFLVVTYRELRNLELRILLSLQELGDKEVIPTLFFGRNDIAVKLDNIFGIEIEEWPARIAQTALLLTEHQANRQMELALGNAPSILPLETVGGIRIGNALRMPWESILQPNDSTFVIGNPPFIGHISKSEDQIADLKNTWGDGYDGYLDYVTGWYKKAIDYLTSTKLARFAFVSTNSICQGQPVEALFKPIFDSGWRIRFAHQTFAWSSEAPGAAAVHCVIVGFDKKLSAPPELYVYAAIKSDPVKTSPSEINGYLVDARPIFVTKRMQVLSEELPPVSFGTMPVDGGNLLIEAGDYAEVMADPVAAKYVRKFVMGKELINNLERFCLWLVDLEPEDLDKSRILKSRIESCRSYRDAAPKAGDAYKYRNTPHLFRPNANQPKSRYLAIPAVFSESRFWATCDSLPPEVIAGNKVYVCDDPDGFAFAIVSSSMFITWQKAVGGRLKSDPSFSNTLVWNNLPLPRVQEGLRAQIIAAGHDILQYRAESNGKSLASLYHPLSMKPELIKLHEKLDRLVDVAFGARAPLKSNHEREQTLFTQYLELSKA